MNLLKRFIPYYKPYMSIFILDLICAVVISAVDLAYPQILRRSADTLFTQDSSIIKEALLPLTLMLLAMYIIQALCKYYVSYKGHMMGASMERDMRKQLFDHYERLSFSYYDKNNSGQMMSRLVSDLFDISEFAHHGPENLFISLVKVIGSFIFLFMINWMLAIPLLFVVMVMFFCSMKQNKAMQATFLDNRKKIGDINVSLQDTLAGIRVVQSFANEEIEREKFKKSNQNFLKSKKANYLCMGRFMSSNGFFQGMMYLVTFSLGGFLIAQGQMTPVDLAMYALYIGIFISPIQILVELTEMFQKGMSGFRRFIEIIDTKPEIVDSENAIDLGSVESNDENSGTVEFKDVTFMYNNEDGQILNNISFKVDSGKSIALVGPSGGGKTTICSLIPRFYDVTEGSVLVNSLNVKDITLKSLRDNIGMVQQDVYMFYGTVKENIAYGKPDATMDEIVDAAKKANIHDFIESLPEGYETFVGERGTRLSGGQKQRISIARVFLKNPPILILDEATSALDNESERHIQKSLEKLAENRTTITIAHRLSTVRNANEIIVLTKDGIKEKGNHKELLAADGLYAYYYNMQFEGLEISFDS